MARLRPETIDLGGRRWSVRPLTVAQVQAVEPLLHQAEGAGTTVAAAVAIIRIALERDDPQGAAALDGLEAGAPAIAAALAAVLRLGGFISGGETQRDADLGEASPAEPAPG